MQPLSLWTWGFLSKPAGSVDFPGWRAEELWDGLHGRLCHPHPWDFKACWGKILSQCVGVESEPSRVPSHWGVSGSCELLYRYYKGLLFNRVYHCIFICYLCEPWMNPWKHEREKKPIKFLLSEMIYLFCCGCQSERHSPICPAALARLPSSLGQALNRDWNGAVPGNLWLK